ncbi:MAG: cadherin-like beta sandwich domain-containing protein, partial [Lachnospiraceae bacterium]|nr:cadherin-like beta sandwich domain-containing protein [Lachnospiraceae bacterium]
MKKKFLASFLSMLLIFSTIPTITYATEMEVETVAAEAETEEETAAVVAETEAQTVVVETETEAQTAADEAGTEREAETSTEEITELQENPDTEFPEETEDAAVEGAVNEDNSEENVAMILETKKITSLFAYTPSVASLFVYDDVTVTDWVYELNDDMVIYGGATLKFSDSVQFNLKGFTLTNYGTINGAIVDLVTSGGVFYNYGIYQFWHTSGTIYDLTLSSIVLSSGTFSPDFTAVTREYAVTVDNSVASIDITPTLNTGSGVKSMTVNGVTATSGAASTVSLSVGVNSIPIVITANDGSDTANTYTLTVTRQSASCSHSSYTNGFCDDCGAYQPATLNGSTYEISNAGQLFWFAALVNGDTSQEGISGANEYANGILTEDIDLGNKDWIPIGNYADLQSHSYRGTFDGGGHTISGLYINNSSSSYQGLFGCVRDGTVQNVTVGGSVSGNAYVGGVVGAAEGGTVTNCGNSASISGDTSVGGVVGNNGGTVTYCYNIGEVSGSDIVGGVVGNNYSGVSVSNCYYLTGTATAAIGLDNGTSTSVAVKTSTQFASGEVAYLLNGSVSGGTTWYQNIDNGKTADTYPVLSSSSGTVYYGTNCAGTAIYSNSTVPAATHSLTYVEAQAETCTETGNSEYWYCSVCEGYFSNSAGTATTTLSGVTIAAKGHDWGGTEYLWYSDMQTCMATRTCQNDSSHIEVAYATITSVEKKAATCTEYGETTYTAVFSESWASEQTKVVAD